MKTEPQEVWQLPVLSQEFLQSPVVWHHIEELRLHYDFETESGAYAWGRLDFEGVAGYRFTVRDACTPDQIDALDSLVEVHGSPWALSLERARMEWPRPTRHLRIYFDDVGCYEVVAAAFSTHHPAPAPAGLPDSKFH